MKKSRYTEEKIIGVLKQMETRSRGGGRPLKFSLHRPLAEASPRQRIRAF